MLFKLTLMTVSHRHFFRDNLASLDRSRCKSTYIKITLVLLFWSFITHNGANTRWKVSNDAVYVVLIPEHSRTEGKSSTRRFNEVSPACSFRTYVHRYAEISRPGRFWELYTTVLVGWATGKKMRRGGSPRELKKWETRTGTRCSLCKKRDKKGEEEKSQRNRARGPVRVDVNSDINAPRQRDTREKSRLGWHIICHTSLENPTWITARRDDLGYTR